MAQTKSGPGFFKVAGIGCGLLVLGVFVLLVITLATSQISEEPRGADGVVGTNRGDVHIPLAVGSTGDIAPQGNPKKRTRITVLSIQDDAKSTNQFSQPAADKKYWVMQVEVQNVGTEEVTSVDWKMRDSEDNELDNTHKAGLGETLAPLYDLTPGGKTTRVVIFEMDRDAQPKWIRADPNPFLKNDLYFDAVGQ